MTQAPRASVAVSWVCLQGIGGFQLRLHLLPCCSQSQNILLSYGGGVLVGLLLLPTAYLHQGFPFGALPPYGCPLACPHPQSIHPWGSDLSMEPTQVPLPLECGLLEGRDPPLPRVFPQQLTGTGAPTGLTFPPRLPHNPRGRFETCLRP